MLKNEENIKQEIISCDMNVYTVVWTNHNAEGEEGRVNNKQYALESSCSTLISWVQEAAK